MLTWHTYAWSLEGTHRPGTFMSRRHTNLPTVGKERDPELLLNLVHKIFYMVNPYGLWEWRGLLGNEIKFKSFWGEGSLSHTTPQARGRKRVSSQYAPFKHFRTCSSCPCSSQNTCRVPQPSSHHQAA